MPEMFTIRQHQKEIITASLAILFFLNVTNIFLYIHLTEHKDDATHNHKTCPICQQAATNKHTVAIYFGPFIVERQQIASNAIYKNENTIRSTTLPTFYSRAPPQHSQSA